MSHGVCQRRCDWCLLGRTEAKRLFCLKDGQKEFASMYFSSLCVSKVKCVCLGRVWFSSALRCIQTTRRKPARMQLVSLTHTQKRTRPRFYEITNTPPDAQTMLAYQQSLCSSACTRMNKPFFVQLWDQIRSWLGFFFFFRGKTVSIYVASKGHLEPSAPWKAIEESS